MIGCSGYRIYVVSDESEICQEIKEVLGVKIRINTDQVQDEILTTKDAGGLSSLVCKLLGIPTMPLP